MMGPAGQWIERRRNLRETIIIGRNFWHKKYEKYHQMKMHQFWFYGSSFYFDYAAGILHELAEGEQSGYSCKFGLSKSPLFVCDVGMDKDGPKFLTQTHRCCRVVGLNNLRGTPTYKNKFIILSIKMYF